MSGFNIIYASSEISELLKGKPQLLVGVLNYYGIRAIHKGEYVHTECPICNTHDCNFRVDRFKQEGSAPFWHCYPSKTNGEEPHHKKCHSSLLGFIRAHTGKPANEVYASLKEIIHSLDDNAGGWHKRQLDLFKKRARELASDPIALQKFILENTSDCPF